jgi:hypothetical protein
MAQFDSLLSAGGDAPVGGGDALSSILNPLTQSKESPLAGMPATKADALATVQEILKAAGIYEHAAPAPPTEAPSAPPTGAAPGPPARLRSWNCVVTLGFSDAKVCR